MSDVEYKFELDEESLDMLLKYVNTLKQYGFKRPSAIAKPVNVGVWNYELSAKSLSVHYSAGVLGGVEETWQTDIAIDVIQWHIDEMWGVDIDREIAKAFSLFHSGVEALPLERRYDAILECVVKVSEIMLRIQKEKMQEGAQS